MMTPIKPMLRTHGGWTMPAGSYWKKLGAGTFLVTVISGGCIAQQWGAQSAPSGSGAFRPEKANTVTPVNQLPDARKQWDLNASRLQLQRFAKANLERKRQMTEDSTRLVQSAAELNRKLENIGDFMPPTAMGRAEMIEKLAHAVKEKMKLTVGGN
jgi:hypothetical protein